MPDPHLKLEHSYRWKAKQGSVQVTCKCGEQSPVFDEVAEWRQVIEWANNHTKETKRV